MAWWEFAWATIVCALVVGIPGVCVALALRLRGLWLAGGAAGIGASLIVAASVFAGWTGISWSFWVVLVTAIVAAGFAWLLTRAAPGTRPIPMPPANRRYAPLVAVALGSALLVGRLAFAIDSPDLFSQVGDNVFHLNAIRFIVDGGGVSPFGFGSFDDPLGEIGAFYPSGWHALAALVVQITGVTVPVASNATLVVVSAVVWPLGVVLLTRTFFGDSAVLLLAAGAVSAGFGAYPLQLIPYMGTYPLLGSIAFIPIALAAILELCGVREGRTGWASAALVLALTIPGIGGMHPSALIMLAVLALPPAAAAALRAVQLRPHLRRLASLLFGLAAVSVFASIVLVRPPLVQDLSWRGTAAQSIGELLVQSLAGQPISLVIAALTIVGIVVGVAHGGVPGRTAFAMWILLGVIYIAAAGSDEFLRILIAGPWYSDATRVAAFSPVVVAPLAALGAQRAWGWIIGLLDGSWVSRNRAAPALLAPIALLLFCALMVQDAAVRSVDTWTRSVFTPTDDPFESRVGLGAHERAVIAKIEELVPAGDVIAGNPRDGSSFAYALTGRHVMLAHILAPLSPIKQTFLEGFATANDRDPACEAARTLNVKWIVEFHPDKLFPTVPRYKGLRDLAESPNVNLAYRSGTSALYQVIGCGIG